MAMAACRNLKWCACVPFRGGPWWQCSHPAHAKQDQPWCFHHNKCYPSEFFKALCQLVDADTRAILAALEAGKTRPGGFQGLQASWPWEGREHWLLSPLPHRELLQRFEIGVITNVQAWEKVLRSDLKGGIMPFSQDCLFPTGACR